MSDTIIVTLTNPANPSETWTSGKRGKPPTWVQMLKASGTVVPKKLPASNKLISHGIHADVVGALRVWRLIGQAGELGDNDPRTQQGRCMIIAKDESEAGAVANATFKYLMSRAELNLLWKEVEPSLVASIHNAGTDVTKPGIYESDGKSWMVRPKSLPSSMV